MGRPSKFGPDYLAPLGMNRGLGVRPMTIDGSLGGRPTWIYIGPPRSNAESR